MAWGLVGLAIAHVLLASFFERFHATTYLSQSITMKYTAPHDVANLYESSADAYNTMMDTEITSAPYTDRLSRLNHRLEGVPGAVLDTSCGPGHMLELYAQLDDNERELVGVDITPRMVALATERLGAAARLEVGDMRHIPFVDDQSVAAVLSYFACHHIDMEGVIKALGQWHRVLRPGGQLLLATWEGTGPIDYGGSSEMVALLHTRHDLKASLESAGYRIDHMDVESVEELGLDAAYIEATRL